MRICSLLPSATEIVFALGLGDSVVGVTHECDYPTEAARKPVVVKSAIHEGIHSSGEINAAVTEHLQDRTGIYAIDLDRFRKADPDLILTQGLCNVCAVNHEDVIQASRSLTKRPAVISLNPSSLSDVLEDIRRVGEATEKRLEADALVRSLEARIQKIERQAARAADRTRLVCLEWLDPFYAAGHWVPEMVQLAGGLDGLGSKGAPSRRVEWNRVVEFSPEVIVLMPCGFDVERTLNDIPLLTRLPRWDQLPAVRSNRVFAVDAGAYFSRSGPRLVDGLEILAQILHPEIFPWRIPARTARAID